MVFCKYLPQVHIAAAVKKYAEVRVHVADENSVGSTQFSDNPGNATGRNRALFASGEWMNPNIVRTPAIARNKADCDMRRSMAIARNEAHKRLVKMKPFLSI